MLGLEDGLGWFGDQRLPSSRTTGPSSRPSLPTSKARPHANAILTPKGSLAFASWVIARLGGWTGYYGKPGPKVMRIGLAEFIAIKYGTTLRAQDVWIR